MTTKAFFFIKNIFFFISRMLLVHLRRSQSNFHANQCKFQQYSSLVRRSDITHYTLVFDVEGCLLKSSSLFPYFMLVAFEAGSILRAFVLLILYPLISFVRENLGLKIMVMVCFSGLKKESFRVGKVVLPKFFLHDIGLEIFEVLKKGRKTVAVSQLPQVMIESFLVDYLEIDQVVGRDLKAFNGFYVGLMENKDIKIVLEDIIGQGIGNSNVIGISGSNKSIKNQFFSQWKEIYVVSKADKRSWQYLPRERYPKPLIFHDGRLAFRPSPLDSLAMMLWIPFGFILSVTRILITISLPYMISTPLLAFSGCRLVVIKSKNSCYNCNGNYANAKSKGILYVCNHRTLLDPLYISFALRKSTAVVTYSLSRFSEFMSPIRTMRLTRNREQDAKMMNKLLNESDLVVCPEGTTCREPYLLRFSPLFTEMSEYIVPIAIDTQVSMFYGTTAGGFKSLDSVVFLMNPSPLYIVQLLDMVSGLSKSCDAQDTLRFEKANSVQREIGEVLGFKCTTLTRRDKYMILAGNEGIAKFRSDDDTTSDTFNNAHR